MSTKSKTSGSLDRFSSQPRSRVPATAHDRFILTEKLSLSYNDKPAYKEVSLAIGRNRITALVGPSGCGKTSFLLSLNRLSDLILRCKVSGSIKIGDQQILAPGVDVVALRRRVGMIFQKPAPFPFSISKNLAFPLREHGITDRETIQGLSEAALRDVGLWDEIHDRLDSSAQSLSGGQQQRLCLARALVLKPEVILLDEPCSALDPIASGVVEDLIVSLREQYTIIIVTHNLAQARRIADQVAVFWFRDGSGRLLESGTVRQVFESPQDEITRAYVCGQRG